MSLFHFTPKKEAKEFKPRKCPKCGSIEILLIEIWVGHSIMYGQEADGTTYESGDLEPGGPERVDGKCEGCGHGWRLRGGSQIDDFAYRVDAFGRPSNSNRWPAKSAAPITEKTPTP